MSLIVMCLIMFSAVAVCIAFFVTSVSGKTRHITGLQHMNYGYLLKLSLKDPVIVLIAIIIAQLVFPSEDIPMKNFLSDNQMLALLIFYGVVAGILFSTNKIHRRTTKIALSIITDIPKNRQMMMGLITDMASANTASLAMMTVLLLANFLPLLLLTTTTSTTNIIASGALVLLGSYMTWRQFRIWQKNKRGLLT